MSEPAVSLDELGPVDYLVVEFPPGRSTFTGEMAAELSRLSHEGLIRVLDLLVMQKSGDGTVEGFEVDADGLGGMRSLEADLAGVLAAQDVEDLAVAMQPGSVAGVVVWENLWATPFSFAARSAGGQIIAGGRIPIQAIAASLEADEEDTRDGPET